MDIDSPTSHRSEDEEEEEEEESGYNAELLELEPLREDSEELLDDASKLEDDEQDNKEGDEDDDNGDDDDDEQQDASSSDGEEDDDDAHVQGLTSNEREILTLLAVDKKLASLLDLAANALSALRPKEVPQEASAVDSKPLVEQPTVPQPESPLKTFESASAEYYKALDDIQLTLRNSIHLIRKARISPRTLMENPSLGSVLSNTILVDSGKDDNNERINIAPGVVSSSAAGLSRGAQRMEIETWKQSVQAMRGLLESFDKPASKSEP